MSWATSPAIWPKVLRCSCSATARSVRCRLKRAFPVSSVCAHPIVKVLAFFLGGDDFGLQGFLLQPDGLDFRAHFLRVALNLVEKEDDHADGDEELQHRGNKETGAVKISIFAGKRVAPEVNDPEQKAQRQHAQPHERLLLPQSKKTNAGKRAAQAQQNEHRQMDLQRVVHHLRTGQNPDRQEYRRTRRTTCAGHEGRETACCPTKGGRPKSTRKID